MAIQTLHPSFTSATSPISLRRTSASRLCCLHPPRRGPPDRKGRSSPSSSLIPSFTQQSEIVDQTRRPPLPMIHGRQLRSQNLSDQEVASLLKSVIRNRRPEAAEQILHELKSRGFNPGCDILSDLMLCYAKSGSFRQAQALWSEIIHSSFVPSIEVIWALMKAYARMDQFDEITRIVNEISLRNFESSPHVYSMAISCFGKAGQLQLMEDAIKEMVSRGFKVDSFTGNSFVKYYSIYGSLEEMEAAYARLKKSRILIEKEAIRAMASAYINQNEFYKFGEFLRDLGLGRRNLGNLLWNLLLLSYAANFKMKSLQREFLSMLDAGFSPDITTFNIRTLAFSRMSMFWDLHLSIEHMHRKGVAPDLVTYGCIVDAYMNRRLAKNISFALGKFDIESTPSIFTDPLVFEVFGKGDFHTSCEALLQSTRQREWPYSKLLAIHLKKQYRRNQIFWNY